MSAQPPQGEAPPPYGPDGLPVYVTLKNAAVPRKLRKFAVG